MYLEATGCAVELKVKAGVGSAAEAVSGSPPCIGGGLELEAAYQALELTGNIRQAARAGLRRVGKVFH